MANMHRPACPADQRARAPAKCTNVPARHRKQEQYVIGNHSLGGEHMRLLTVCGPIAMAAVFAAPAAAARATATQGAVPASSKRREGTRALDWAARSPGYGAELPGCFRQDTIVPSHTSSEPSGQSPAC
jgi:hypothetical protein